MMSNSNLSGHGNPADWQVGWISPAYRVRERGQDDLAGRRIGNSQLAVGGTPNAAHTAASADEQGGGGEADKSQKQRILNQILTLFVVDEIA